MRPSPVGRPLSWTKRRSSGGSRSSWPDFFACVRASGSGSVGGSGCRDCLGGGGVGAVGAPGPARRCPAGEPPAAVRRPARAAAAVVRRAARPEVRRAASVTPVPSAGVRAPPGSRAASWRAPTTGAAPPPRRARRWYGSGRCPRRAHDRCTCRGAPHVTAALGRGAGRQARHDRAAVGAVDAVGGEARVGDADVVQGPVAGVGDGVGDVGPVGAGRTRRLTECQAAPTPAYPERAVACTVARRYGWRPAARTCATHLPGRAGPVAVQRTERRPMSSGTRSRPPGQWSRAPGIEGSCTRRSCRSAPPRLVRRYEATTSPPVRMPGRRAVVPGRVLTVTSRARPCAPVPSAMVRCGLAASAAEGLPWTSSWPTSSRPPGRGR